MRRNWKLAAVVFLACVGCSLALGFLFPSYWRVEETLIPVPRSSMGNQGLGSLAGLAGGLGDLGMLIGRQGSSQDEAVALLSSRELFDTDATRENLLPILFASKWDGAGRRWLVSGASVPTLRRGYRLFNRGIRDIDLDRRSGIVTLSITWKDRAQAVKWARGLVDLVNAQMRARAVAQAEHDMRYLDAAIRKAGSDNDSNQLTSALSSAYERSVQDYMFAQGQPEYAFRIIDPPTWPDDRERVWPQRTVFAGLGLVLGMLFAVGVVYAREWWIGRRHDPAGAANVISAPNISAAGISERV